MAAAIAQPQTAAASNASPPAPRADDHHGLTQIRCCRPLISPRAMLRATTERHRHASNPTYLSPGWASLQHCSGFWLHVAKPEWHAISNFDDPGQEAMRLNTDSMLPPTKLWSSRSEVPMTADTPLSTAEKQPDCPAPAPTVSPIQDFGRHPLSATSIDTPLHRPLCIQQFRCPGVPLASPLDSMAPGAKQPVASTQSFSPFA